MKMRIDLENLRTTLQRLRLASLTLVKWLICSCASGLVIGLIGSLFHELLDAAAEIRHAHPWILFLLPAAGIIIVLIYHLAGIKSSKGTNLVITAIQSNEEVPVRMAPLIIASTILTHLCGGSAAYDFRDDRHYREYRGKQYNARVYAGKVGFKSYISEKHG